MQFGQVNVPVEITFAAAGGAAAELSATVTGAEGRRWELPAFWRGGATFSARFAAPAAGRYRVSVPGASDELEIPPYAGGSALYRHGRLRVGEGGRTFAHADGTPFLWLADTWWMGLTTRLDWPSGFHALLHDRVAKGFNAVQIVAGPLPDYCATTRTWDPGHCNEAGWPWVERPGRDPAAWPTPADFLHPNPAFYDLADQRIAALCEAGVVPCIVSMWGYFLPFMGAANVQRHWRYLAARYAAYPVAWCLAGEVLMPTYALHGAHGDVGKEHVAQQREGWTAAARDLRGCDPFGNLISAHPGSPNSARQSLPDAGLLDFDMLQTGHSGYHSLRNSLKVLDESYAMTPAQPVFNSEVCYEGIMGGSRDEIQRFLFWTSVLSGAAGHTYGAQGIWGMHSRHGALVGSTMNWGDGVWQDVMHYAGSRHVGLGAAWLRRYPWQRFARLRAEPTSEKGGAYTLRAAGVRGVVQMHYLPAMCMETDLWGRRSQYQVPLADGERYARVFYFNPRTGDEVPATLPAATSGGMAPAPRCPSMEDWVLVLANPEATAG